MHRRVCSRFGVNGYPSLFFVKDGHVYKYQGARNLNAYVEFACPLPADFSILLDSHSS